MSGSSPLPGVREEHRSGLDYLEAVTALLRGVRSSHPTKGLYEAADLQWWWRTPRPTDTMPQLFWFDREDQLTAAVIATQWHDRVSLDPIYLPDTSSDFVAHVIERGLAHAGEWGLDTVELEVDRDDKVLQEVLAGHGFTVEESGLMVEAWLDAQDRSAVSPLHDGYRLSTRAAMEGRPHHLARRGGPDIEARLAQMSMYRPDLDLVVVHGADDYAAYGLFWYDPVTSTGLVEPMRTEDAHQRRGLARHVLTAGVERLAAAGAERIKICYESDHPAAGHLYRSVGFQPVKETDLYGGGTGVAAVSSKPDAG